MALFSGPRATPPPEEDRAGVQALTAVASPAYMGNYATVQASPMTGAQQSVAIRTTVDLIASLASELPVQAYNGAGKLISTPSNVMDPAGDGTGVEDWLYRLLSSWLLAGNAYGEALAWDSRGNYITQFDLFHPDDVAVSLQKGRPAWNVLGKPIDTRTFVHRRVNPVAGRVLGLSPIEMHASQLGISLSATAFGRQWFVEGAHPSGMLTNDANLNAAEAQIAKDRFAAATQGSREPLVLGKGWKFQDIQVSPEESQFLQTMGWSEAQCARIFGPGFAEILGYPTGDTMTYGNVVDRRQDLLVFSLNRWLRRVDRVLSLMIPSPQTIKLNRDALLEATTLQRYQAHASALQNRWRTVNEVREIEDMPPVSWGNDPNDATPVQKAGGDYVGSNPA